MFLSQRHFRLARTPDRGLTCDANGVSLGRVPLLRRTDAGLEARLPGEIDVLAKAAYGAGVDAEALTRGLLVAARALNDGDLGRAMVATVHLRLPALDDAAAARISAVDAVLAKYSPDQPRDWHGRWTTDGGGASAGDPTDGRHIDVTSNVCQDSDGDPVGIGDNNGPALEPQGERGPEPEADPALPAQKVPVGWDQPGRIVNGVYYPAGRYPTLKDGRPWPTAEPNGVLDTLRRIQGDDPMMRLYIARDGVGPTLIGSTDKEEFEQPPGYDVVSLRGLPQRTMSRGVETAHALDSVTTALDFAESNQYSDIFFNRSFSTISNGRESSRYRPDVVGLRRPTLEGKYDVYEVLSPRQSGPAREQVLRPAVPGMWAFNSHAYKLLLKLLRALGLS